jgi:hypothetical protein
MPRQGGSPASVSDCCRACHYGHPNECERTTVIAKYRKKPVEIEAVQLTDNWTKVCDWINASGVNPNVYEADRRIAYMPSGPNADIAIRTLEGEMRAVPGDWIIRGVKGEFYPVKPDIFAETYEAVDA